MLTATNLKYLLYRTRIGAASLFYQGYRLWTTIPKCLHECKSTNAFPKEYQKNILKQMPS